MHHNITSDAKTTPARSFTRALEDTFREICNQWFDGKPFNFEVILGSRKTGDFHDKGDSCPTVKVPKNMAGKDPELIVKLLVRTAFDINHPSKRTATDRHPRSEMWLAHSDLLGFLATCEKPTKPEDFEVVLGKPLALSMPKLIEMIKTARAYTPNRRKKPFQKWHTCQMCDKKTDVRSHDLYNILCIAGLCAKCSRELIIDLLKMPAPDDAMSAELVYE